jgi:hypothetical protein
VEGIIKGYDKGGRPVSGILASEENCPPDENGVRPGTGSLGGGAAVGENDDPSIFYSELPINRYGPMLQSAEELSRKHKDAATLLRAGISTPTALADYGGNCNKNQYDDLARQKDKACSSRVSCHASMDQSQLIVNRNLHRQCARLREDIMNQCFDGGDDGHRTQANEAWNGAARCAELLR